MSQVHHNMPQYKVRWTYKLTMFVASVIALSWFFAGWRQVQEASTVANWSLLIGSTALTGILVLVQGYWIYFEEKSKGTLRKRIEWFEKLHCMMDNSKSGQCNKKGEPKAHD